MLHIMIFALHQLMVSAVFSIIQLMFSHSHSQFLKLQTLHLLHIRLNVLSHIKYLIKTDQILKKVKI